MLSSHLFYRGIPMKLNKVVTYSMSNLGLSDYRVQVFHHKPLWLPLALNSWVKIIKTNLHSTNTILSSYILSFYTARGIALRVAFHVHPHIRRKETHHLERNHGQRQSCSNASCIYKIEPLECTPL